MALSRFWSYIIVCSVVYIFYLLATDQLYQLGQLVNGKQNDALVIAEVQSSTDSTLFQNILLAKPNGYLQGDTLFRLLDNGIVEICKGKQPADGIFATCKNTMIDLWLPLIGYLTFFCGLLNLLNDSNAIAKLAGVLTPFFVRIFPDLPMVL
jgi:hypothetical protein